MLYIRWGSERRFGREDAARVEHKEALHVGIGLLQRVAIYDDAVALKKSEHAGMLRRALPT